MFTEQTHLFNIFLFFFATILAGYKMRSFSKASHTRRSERNILVINNGRTDEFILKISKYLEKHMTFDISEIDVKDVKEQKLEKFKDEAAKYSKTILVCKIADRMELYQQEMIQGLDKKIEGLQVFYIINQRSGSHYVDDCKAKQINVIGGEVDEEFITENFKDYVEMTAEEKWLGRARALTGILAVFFVLSLYGYLQSESQDTIGADQIQEISRLRDHNLEMSQSYQNLLQKNLNLSKDNDGMKFLLDLSEQEVYMTNEKLIEMSENNKNLEDIRLELEMVNKALKEENKLKSTSLSFIEEEKKALERANRLKSLENERLLLNAERLQNKFDELESQNRETNNEKAELNRKYEELQDLYDQEKEKNKFLTEENTKLKRRVEELERKMEQRETKFSYQQEELQNELINLRADFENELNSLKIWEQKYKKIVPKLDYANERMNVLENRIRSDVLCNVDSIVKDLFSWDLSPKKYKISRK